MSKSQLKLENVVADFKATLQNKDNAIAERQQEKENFINEFSANHSFFKKGEQLALVRDGGEAVPLIVENVEFMQTIDGKIDFIFTFTDGSVIMQSELEKEEYSW